MNQVSFCEKSISHVSCAMSGASMETVPTSLDAHSVKKDSLQADETICTLSSADCAMFQIAKNVSRG